MEPIREKIVLIPDHFVPAKDIASAIQARKLRDFVWKYGIENYFEVGGRGGGVCHQVMMEQGFAAPGRLIAGADSHTCTYGALGAISVGIGSTEAGVIFATGRMWFRVPQSMRFQVDGEPDPYVEGGKDIILRVISEIGVEGARYRSMEFYGSTISLLDVAERMTIANMTTEAGAKCAYVHVDKKTHEYLRGGRVRGGTYREVSADSDAEYVSDIHIDATELEPQVALPGSPDNVRPVSEVDDHIDQAYIGSCTNGRLEDIRKAAEILRGGRKVHPSVRLIVVPSSQRVYEDAIREGLAEIIVEAGGFFSGPTCGACLAATWVSSGQGGRCAYQARTGTSWAGWVTGTRRSTWRTRLWWLRAQLQAE